MSIRLYSTLSRRLEELPPPPGPIRMYVCGSTVYAARPRRERAAVRARHVAAALAALARVRGHARPQHHRRQRQDLRGSRAARDRQRATSPRRRPAGSSRTPTRSGSAGPTSSRGRARRSPRSSRSSRRSSPTGQRVRGRRATSTSGSRAYPRLRAAVGRSGPTTWSRQEPNPAKEDPRDFALWKAQKPDEDAAWDSPWGPRPPGLAHRVLGDGREAPRAGVRDPRRRARPRLPAPRERARAVAVARLRVRAASGCTTGCSSSATRRCRSRSGTWSRCGTCSTPGGARRCCSST